MTRDKNNAREALKKIPSIDELLDNFPLSIPNIFYKDQINSKLNIIRDLILKGKLKHDIKDYCFNEISELSNTIAKNSLSPVINGTGIILHTGLGRAPISKDILIDGILKNYPYSNLEIDISNGKRGDRNIHISSLINSICTSESTLIVNNNAAAVILMLNSICENKEVLISRGQLVEIGGSFRIPDIMKKSQCKMIEVGTTNKTHINDYEKAINSNTSAILYVHTSNYKVIGFTNEVKVKELSKLSKKFKIPLLIDLGSGSFAEFKDLNLTLDKMVEHYIKLGANLVTFSGDKLLGGPQAGIITGEKKIVDKIYINPLYRAFRFDKIRLSILESILRTYYSSKIVAENNLTISLFKRSQSKLLKFANSILNEIDKNSNYYSLDIKETIVEAGSGSLPTEEIPSIAINIKSKYKAASKIYNQFLKVSTPVIGYINNNIFYIDLKAITEDQSTSLLISIKEVLLWLSSQ